MIVGTQGAFVVVVVDVVFVVVVFVVVVVPVLLPRKLSIILEHT